MTGHGDERTLRTRNMDDKDGWAEAVMLKAAAFAQVTGTLVLGIGMLALAYAGWRLEGGVPEVVWYAVTFYALCTQVRLLALERAAKAVAHGAGAEAAQVARDASAP
jgi:hypothetical protein